MWMHIIRIVQTEADIVRVVLFTTDATLVASICPTERSENYTAAVLLLRIKYY